jgi:hypothetical protein
MVSDSDHSVDRYRSAVHNLRTGLLSLKILESDVSPENVPRSAAFEVEFIAASDFRFEPLLKPRPAGCPLALKF